MAYDVGDIAVPHLEVTPFDETTAATVAVLAPDGTTTTPTPTSADDGNNWDVQVPVTAAGTWYVTWTVTGPGAGVTVDVLEVEPVPPATDAQRRVRLLINDTDRSNRFFATTEIDDFLTLTGGSVRRAAAMALDTIAANEALVSKKIRTQDLSTDGPAVAEALRKLAAELRRQEDAAEGDAEASGFEIVEFDPYGSRPELAEY